MQEQSSYAGSTVVVMVETINKDTGAHEASTINTSTTRLFSQARDLSAVVPTVDSSQVVGKHIITFSGITPPTTPGEVIMAKVNGQLDSPVTPWTEKGIKIQILASADVSNIPQRDDGQPTFLVLRDGADQIIDQIKQTMHSAEQT